MSVVRFAMHESYGNSGFEDKDNFYAIFLCYYERDVWSYICRVI